MHDDLDHPRPEEISITDVLAALASPLRLDVVRRLSEGEELTCGTALPGTSKSTASHHWKVLRRAGVLQQRREGRVVHMSLRRTDLDARFPGLIDAVLSADRDGPRAAG